MKNTLKSRRAKWSAGIVMLLVLSIGLVSFSSDERNFSILKNLDIYYTMFRELNSYYVDETNPEKLIKTSIDKMLESLDPYTTYIPESEIEDFKFMTTGEYGGIGSLISHQGEYVIIAEPYEGFPAQKNGLKAGDKITEVDGQKVKGKNTSEVSDLLKGTANTLVKITVERLGAKKPISFEFKREKIQINPVPYFGMLNKEVGIIILNNFTQNCSKEVEKAFLDLRDNQKAQSIILDLRSNPGGLLDEAVKIANLFIAKDQEVVSTKGKVKQWDKIYKATQQPVDTVMPLAVLINRGSASASEIVAGSLQDLDRAIVIGNRSFGKGLVQTTRNLSYNSKLKVTTAKYYIPSGRCIQALDYSHRNEDGSVGHVPDSLITEYKTKNGRKVYDGGGISPDIKVEHEKYNNITFALVTQSVLFDYATLFASETSNIKAPDVFTIDDEIYGGLKDFVKAKEGFKYESATQDALKELIDIAKKEDYYKNSKEKFDSLEDALSLNIEKDMDVFREEIQKLLSIEITKRYYYQKGAIIQGLKEDKDIEKAIEALSVENKYKDILTGVLLSHAGDKRQKTD